MPLELEADEAQIYYGFDFPLTDKITIHNPRVGEIVAFGEKKYYSAVATLTCIPSDMKFQLEDMGFNYMEVKDFDLFMLLVKGLKPEQTSLLFGDLDFSSLQPMRNPENDEIILASEDGQIRIDSLVYAKLTKFICRIHRIVPKIEKAANETTRKLLIQLDREKAMRASKQEPKSQIVPLTSALMRTPSCSMSLEEIKQLPVYAFMDAVMGAQVFTATNALLIGSYSGMIDTSKINKKEFDWMRDPNERIERKSLKDSETTKSSSKFKPSPKGHK